MNKLIEQLTPLIIVQMILSVLVVVTFCYQEFTLHTVDADLKFLTVGVITFWLGGIAFAGQQKLADRSKPNGE